MKNKIGYGLLFIIIGLFSACIMDSHIGLCIIKNNTTHDLVAAYWDESPITDSLLYNNKIYMGSYIQPKLTSGIGGPFNNFDVRNDPDSKKAFVYIFNSDSIDRYRALKISNGILKNSLLKKIIFQVNKIKDPPDTIYINSSIPGN